jgi:hypothetical protein
MNLLISAHLHQRENGEWLLVMQQGTHHFAQCFPSLTAAITVLVHQAQKWSRPL